MNTSISWMKAYVPELNVTAKEYMDAMTLSGTKVEEFKCLDADLENIVVGQVKKIDRHPDADKLVICQVDVGQPELVQIVTGASNVFEGAKVPVVLDGGRVAGGHDGSKIEGGIKIKKGKLRGVESFGMMCSIEELGSSKEMYPDAPEDGLYIMSEDTPVGADAVEVLGLHDAVFEYEITSNRVDCYSVLGIAREAAATFNTKFVMPQIKTSGNNESASDYIDVEVKDTDLCPRYVARVVKNVKIAPSPVWMQRRLASCGIRPINNVVDITNYVMEEFGQPMHAFDYDKIGGHKIIVKRAADGDKFITLDGQERNLDSEVLTINDADKQIAIAGIMGGENSMITDDVQTLVFESATFNGTNIRKSSNRIGLRTDASTKYEKGLDPENAMAAIDRACALIEELGAGEVVGGCVDVYSTKKPQVRVKFEPDAINKLLGTDISREDMLKYLAKVELFLDENTEEIIVPSFRQDVYRTCDIAEEVARFYGYDKIPTTLPKSGSSMGGLSYKLRIEAIARATAEYNGFSEAMNYSFESPKAFDKLLLPADSMYRKAIEIKNPLGEDFSVMRTLSLNGILTSLGTNFARRNKAVKLYELANTYIPHKLPLTELPDERMEFTLGMYDSGDFYDMKGVVEEFLEKAGLKGLITYDSSETVPYLHPGRQAQIIYDHVCVGELGEVHPLVCKNYGIKTRVYVAVLHMPEITPLTGFDYKFNQIPKFPVVSRDISMIIGKDVQVGTIENLFRKNGGKLLENFKLFDVYESDQIGKDKKSVAFSLEFRGKDKTLEDADIEPAMNKIIKKLAEIGISLRD